MMRRVSSLVAPFPYYGGKLRWANDIWKRFGKPKVYVEPFAGSLAVLLANPHPADRELVCDKDGHICNFWRATRDDPEKVAYYADYPTIHQDLSARHKWLVEWASQNSKRLSDDPAYCDAKAAGWWVWGISLWIGGGWCSGKLKSDHGEAQDVDQQNLHDKRPSVVDSGGQGVSAQRKEIPFGDTRLYDARPYVGNKGSGRGVSSQTVQVPFADNRPFVGGKGGGQGVSAQTGQIPWITSTTGGRGVCSQRVNRPYSGSSLFGWFDALSERMKAVIVLNRDWKSAVTSTVLQDTKTGPGDRINRCILLDPPYLTTKRASQLYLSDIEGSSDRAAFDAYEWAIAHGDRYRIAYCAHEGDFALPQGWTSLVRKFDGPNVDVNNRSRDCIMFSPSCLSGSDKQFSLF